MADINEKIVQQYFELQGYMVRANLTYVIKKGSSGDSDIDLAIYHIHNRDMAIVEVKGWHTSSFTRAFLKKNTGDNMSRSLLFIRPQALKVAKEFFKTEKFRKILVVPKLSVRQALEIKKMLKDKYGIEVLEFTNILQDVISMTKANKNYGHSEFQQTVRLMKTYKFIKSSDG